MPTKPTVSTFAKIAEFRGVIYTIVAAAIAAALIDWYFKDQKKKRNQDAGSQVPVNSSWLDPNTSYDAIVQQMRAALEGILDSASDKGRAIDKWLSLNDEEFKHCCNLYNERFAKAPDTIRQDITGEWAINPWKATAFIDRLDRLGLA